MSAAATLQRAVSPPQTGQPTGPVSGSSPGNDPHSLSLRVLRLAKPGFSSNLAYSLPSIAGEPPTTPSYGFGLRDSVVVPNAFGIIHAGETLRCFVNITNISPVDVTNVWYRVELRMAGSTGSASTQPHTLVDTHDQPLAKLGMGECKDFLVQSALEDPGEYVLLCYVTYTRRDEEKQLNKIFKIQLFELSHGLYVESCVTNETNTGLLFDKIVLEPTEWYSCTTITPVLSSPSANMPSLPLFSSLQWVLPGQSISCLFSLTPKDPVTFNIRQGRDIGRVAVTWHSTLGDVGRYNTTLLKRKFSEEPETLELTLQSVPRVFLERPFSVQCILTNKSTSTFSMRVQFADDPTGGLLVHGITGIQGLITLSPGQAHAFSLNLLPLKPGVQQIYGMRVVDSVTNRELDFVNLMEILVEQEDTVLDQYQPVRAEPAGEQLEVQAPLQAVAQTLIPGFDDTQKQPSNDEQILRDQEQATMLLEQTNIDPIQEKPHHSFECEDIRTPPPTEITLSQQPPS